MTLGIDSKNKNKVIALGILAVLAAYLVYDNLLSGPSIPKNPAQTARSAAPAQPAIPLPTGPAGTPKRGALSRNRSEEVHWVFMPKRPEERPDPASIDPTLFLDRLAKVQAVDLDGGSRNLFQFSTPPQPKVVEMPKGPEPKVAVVTPPPEPPKPVVTAPVEPVAVPPPYKFYGYSTARANGKKTAYFLDGEDILLATEGDTLKRKYKVLRIGPNSVTIEDLDAKKQVSVPLTEESQS
jgi:hypothetical protein